MFLDSACATVRVSPASVKNPINSFNQYSLEIVFNWLYVYFNCIIKPLNFQLTFGNFIKITAKNIGAF